MYKQIDSNKQKTILFITGFLVFVIGFGWVLAQYYQNPLILIIAVAVSVIQAYVSYFYSDKVALAVSRAEPLEKKDAPELYRIVENLSITAGIPMPKIYLLPDSAMNAFATGRDPKHASIAVTQGLLEKMNKTQIEGVLAHELSHVIDYDIRVSSLVVVLVGVITLASDLFLRSMWWGGGRRNDDREGGNAGAIFLLIGIVLAILGPLVATLIQLAVSRKREFLADANGALLTRYPEGLASALEKIAADDEPMSVANKATAHMYFTNPLQNLRGTLNNLFSTHPPIEERIKALRDME